MKRTVLALALLPALAVADLDYTLQPDVATKSVRVSLQVNPLSDKTTFRIPAWTPGYYYIEEFENKIADFHAVDGAGKELKVEHVDKRAWSVTNRAKGSVTVSYRTIGDDPGLGFFGVSVLPHTAYVNGASTFLFPENRLTEKIHLRIIEPEGWQTATAMDAAPGRPNEFLAGGYDELIDHPIQMGHFEIRKFSVGGIPFEAVYVSADGTYHQDLDASAAELQGISRPAIQMFGGAPFKRYVYIVHLAIGNFSGGLEHRASTVITYPPSPDKIQLDEIAAHEFFHSWNVKQIRPQVLGPFDYTKEAHTENLWFAEGVTDYYGFLDTYRAGMWSKDELLRNLTGDVAELQSGKTRKSVTLAQTSERAWESGGLAVGDLSYYTKGLLVGLIFDASIREATAGRKSLDDVMRLLFNRYRLPHVGYGEDGILQAIDEVCGKDMAALYTSMVRSVDELPYDQLQKLGLRVLIPGQTYLDPGFRLVGDRLDSVDASVQTAGGQNGDRMLRLAPHPSDTGMTLSVDRQGKRVDVAIKPAEKTAENYSVEIDPFADPEATARRNQWLQRPDAIEKSGSHRAGG